jgi:hypothetical protein
MKKITRFITLAFVLLMACKKDFIIITPTSNVSIDILFKTDKDYQDAVIGCYNTLQGLAGNIWQFGDLRGDDTQAGITSNTPTYAYDIDQFYINNDAVLLSETWRDWYKLIYRTNTILSNIAGADPTIVTLKNRHIAEAKFLRALAYFYLVRIFGDVPMVTTPITVEESFKIPRESVDNIYDKIIISDLLVAENGLSLKYTGADVGRATIGAAKAILGKVYLTRYDLRAEAEVILVVPLKVYLMHLIRRTNEKILLSLKVLLVQMGFLYPFPRKVSLHSVKSICVG